VFFSRGQSAPAVIVLSLIIFAAAGVGVAALRTFMPLTSRAPREGTQVLGGRTRVALEREKTLVLRSIKELEFDRDMGKVSEKDFGEMSARLRARAAGLMRQLDAGTGYRQLIEREIEKRIGKEDASAKKGLCAQCKTQNDRDARFCKQCGSKLEAAS
jgi:ribosomal protein L40E